MKSYCFDICRGIDKESDAGIGAFAMFYFDQPDSCYGRFCFGVFVGRYCLSLDGKKGFRFSSGNATGCGG